MTDPLTSRLRAACHGAEVLDALVDRVQWAADASIYRLVPRVVVIPAHVGHIQGLLAVAHAEGVPVCFRAGGTSLSGQAVTDGILVVISKRFRDIEVLDGGAAVRCAPGAVGSWVNAALAPYGRRIGPDPASIQAAEIGGIVANNASGMCCGVHENSYNTVTGLDLVLADGYRIDTGVADADERLRRERPALAAGLMELAKEITFDPELATRIRTAFATKNTVGYSLNAFLDAAGPAGILQRLVVGSEGTLAFINAATFRTIPLPRFRATAFLLFRDVEAAGRAVAPLAEAGAKAIELLDAAALKRVREELPDGLPEGEPAALLIEFQELESELLDERVALANALLADMPLVAPARFTRDAALQAAYWHIRKGLFPSVGAVRKAGTAVIIEDVTFPVAQLAEGVHALHTCFATHGYTEAVIFGHAKDGNLHFVITPDLSRPDERTRYDGFMQAMCRLVVDMGGHLKAEHGTGRNIAPFVELQWGPRALALMWRVKRLLDPANLINPGVLLTTDPQAHLKDLKILPPVDPLVDRCIECGFCEPVCPSRDVTYSPRQRIAAMRARAGDGDEAAAVAKDWQYRALDTCAADGLCESACPVHINTGDLVKAERAARAPGWAKGIAAYTAEHIALITGLSRFGLRFVGGLKLPGRAIRLPRASPGLPATLPSALPSQPTYVFLPTCLTRMFGPDAVAKDLATLCAAAGVGLRLPPDVDSLCCGQPWQSKGFPDAGRSVAERTVRAILAVAPDCAGVVIDTSTCAHQLEGAVLPPGIDTAWNALPQFHPAKFFNDVLLPRLGGRLAKAGDLVAHPTCSEQKHGWTGQVKSALSALGEHAHVPDASGCCGMAGDRGWLVPELTAGATAREAAEAKTHGSVGACTSLTCGSALSAATGLPYRHLFSLAAERLT